MSLDKMHYINAEQARELTLQTKTKNIDSILREIKNAAIRGDDFVIINKVGELTEDEFSSLAALGYSIDKEMDVLLGNQYKISW